MNIRIRELKKFKFYDKTLSHIETPQGTLTLVSVFLPFLVEMLLTNSMGTVNTLVLSHYSDEEMCIRDRPYLLQAQVAMALGLE